MPERDRHDIERQDWDTLLARYRPIVQSLVTRRLHGHHRHAIDDVTQGIVLRLYQELAGGRRYTDRTGRPIPFRVVVHKVTGWEIGGYFQDDANRPLPQSDPPDRGATDAGYADRLALIDLDACLDRLGPVEREVCRLTLLEDLPASEVAARLGITPNNVYQRVHHGLRKLGECLDER